MNEFLSRFFARQGYKDGLHGLALSLLQAVSFLVVQLKVWQAYKFKEREAKEIFEDTMTQFKKANNDLLYWYYTTKKESEQGVGKALNQLRAKIRL